MVGVLHSNGLWELAEHPLLEGFQSLIIMSTAHVFFVLPKHESTIYALHVPCLHLYTEVFHKHSLAASFVVNRYRAQYSVPVLREMTVEKGEGQMKN